MRVVKSFKPVDIVVRGAFVAAVVAGGLADLAHSSPAAQAEIIVPAAAAPALCHLSRHDARRAELGLLANTQPQCATL